MSKKKYTLNKAKQNPIIGYIQNHLGVIISILIPSTIFLVGYAYEHGYLTEFGIKSDAFSRGVEYYLVQGFYLILKVIFTSMNYFHLIWIPIVIVFFLYPVYNIDRVILKKEDVKEKPAKTLKKNSRIKALIFDTIGYSILTLLVPVIIIAVSYAYFGSFNELSRFYGRDYAVILKHEFKEKDGCKSNVHHTYTCIYDGDKSVGALITMQNDIGYIWDGKYTIQNNLNGKTFKKTKPPIKKPSR